MVKKRSFIRSFKRGVRRILNINRITVGPNTMLRVEVSKKIHGAGCVELPARLFTINKKILGHERGTISIGDKLKFGGVPRKSNSHPITMPAEFPYAGKLKVGRSYKLLGK